MPGHRRLCEPQVRREIHHPVLPEGEMTDDGQAGRVGKAAEQVEQAFENSAAQLDNAAENASGAVQERLEDEAEVMRQTGEAAAEAIDDVDLNTQANINAQQAPANTQ